MKICSITATLQILLAFFACFNLFACFSRENQLKNAPPADPRPHDSITCSDQDSFLFSYPVTREVKVQDYFQFMDSLILRLDTLVNYPLDEYILVHANRWIMDSLMNTDYYRRKSSGTFVYDQKQLVILHPGDRLRIPGDSLAARISAQLKSVWIDVNIPEFRLRVVHGMSDTLFSIPVRVGQNRRQYLEVIDRIENLRTRTGVGEIIRINRNPSWTNPVTGKSYKETRRDDGLRTRLPLIPWLEPALNGNRYGQMIHPTTNEASLGKAYSNGCIGAGEADAWHVYFYAPLGTKVVVRYDRFIQGPSGDTLVLPDVYNKKGFRLRH